MKRTLLLWALMLGCICAALAQPQTKIRIDGREATAAEYDALPKERVKSLSWSREGEVRVLNITLKQEAATRSEVPEGALVLQPAPASATPEERWNHLRDQLFAPSTLLKNGDRAAAFTAERFDGGTVRSDDLRGKVVLLCFWGTWCRPCLEELAPGKLPAVLEPYLGRDDFVLLAAAQDDRKSLARFFASGQRTPYRWLQPYTLLDKGKELFGCFAKEHVPRSVLVDRAGIIAECTMGNNEFELERLRRALAKLFE